MDLLLTEKQWLPLSKGAAEILSVEANGNLALLSVYGLEKRESLSPVWLFVTLTDYTVHEILQARILEWIAFPFSRGSSQPRDQTQVSRIAGRFSTSWATGEAPVG